jgi:hypothetical protein
VGYPRTPAVRGVWLIGAKLARNLLSGAPSRRVMPNRREMIRDYKSVSRGHIRGQDLPITYLLLRVTSLVFHLHVHCTGIHLPHPFCGRLLLLYNVRLAHIVSHLHKIGAAPIHFDHVSPGQSIQDRQYFWCVGKFIETSTS